MTTPLSDVLAAACAVDGALKTQVSSDWMQGRSVYGGLQTALALRVMRSLVPTIPVRSLQSNFIAPLSESMRAECTILREGKNTVQVEAKLFGPDGLTTQVLGVFGKSRASEIKVQMPAEPLEDTPVVSFPFLPGLPPSFTQHFSIRLRKSQLPFSGMETLDAIYELDLHDSGIVTEEHIVVFSDVVPPLRMSVLRTPTFGSTLSWMLEFPAPPKEPVNQSAGVCTPSSFPRRAATAISQVYFAPPQDKHLH
jgi:hypothetical protein